MRRRPYVQICALMSGAALALFTLGCDGALVEAPVETEGEPVIETDELAVATAALTQTSGPIRRWYNSASFQDAERLKATLADLAAARTPILALASAPNGAWVIAVEGRAYTGGTLPSALHTALTTLQRNGRSLRAVALNADSGWVAVGETGWYWGGNVPKSARDKIAQYFANGWTIRDVALTTGGYVVLGTGTLASYAGVDPDLMRFLADRHASKRRVDEVAIGFDGRWAVVAGQEPAFEKISSQLENRLNASARDAVHVSRLLIGPGDSYVVYSHGDATATAGNTIEAIEYGLAGGQTLWARMQAIGLPGLGIAIIEDNRVAYARGYGVLRAGQDRQVLASTPFDMASLSKFLGALTMMRLDTDSRYAFDVDDSVVGRARRGGLIESWLDEGESRPRTYGIPADVDVSSQLTVAHFLRHQTDFIKSGGSPGFTSTFWLGRVTTLRSLLGWDCTSGCGYNGNNVAWSSGGAGPVAPSYDSVNFLVPQAVAEDVTGLPVHELMDDYFFSPMGLTDISGDVDSPILADVAWPHDRNGARSTFARFPWTFAGGVHASVADYAEMMILALNRGRDSRGVQRIPEAAIQRMLQVQNGNVAFGLFADASAHITESNDNRFRHSGSHGGRARAYMCGNPTRDGGIVIAMNADIADGPDANTGNDTVDLRNEILAAFMAEVGWPGDCR